MTWVIIIIINIIIKHKYIWYFNLDKKVQCFLRSVVSLVAFQLRYVFCKEIPQHAILEALLMYTLWHLATFSWQQKETRSSSSKEICQNSAIGNVLENVKTDWFQDSCQRKASSVWNLSEMFFGPQLPSKHTHKDSHQRETLPVRPLSEMFFTAQQSEVSHEDAHQRETLSVRSLSEMFFTAQQSEWSHEDSHQRETLSVWSLSEMFFTSQYSE